MARKRHSKASKRGRRRKTKAVKRGKSHFATALFNLKKLPKRRQVQAIGMANDKFIRQLCSKVKTLRHAKLPAKVTSSFKRHRKQLRSLTNSRVSVKSKRKILTQRGGGFLLPLLAGLAGTVASSLFGRRK